VTSQPTFAELGVDPAIVAALTQQGIVRPFSIQALTLADALAGRDICGKAKTGSGKTLAFGIPLLMRTPRAKGRTPSSLVLVPTRELATQVAEVLLPLGKTLDRRIGAVYGGADIDVQTKQFNSGIDVVIATPGRLIDLVDRGVINLEEITTLVLDEADRMADMGFMPQVEWLLRHMHAQRQTLLFSATLDSAVNMLVSRYLTDPVFFEVESPQATVDQMEHRFVRVHQMDRPSVATAIAKGASKTVIFVKTKRGADRLTDEMKSQGVRVGAIHGDLHQNARERALADFTNGKLEALVATDVAARGLDIDGVDVVIHYTPAEDHKSYLHRSGRTARAGGSGVVFTLMLWNEELEVERLQRRLGLKVPIVELFSNDPRLASLSAWNEDATTSS
jgi:superfamily II DNA/RNA helicase